MCWANVTSAWLCCCAATEELVVPLWVASCEESLLHAVRVVSNAKAATPMVSNRRLISRVVLSGLDRIAFALDYIPHGGIQREAWV
jgi:hypothetical protein